MSLFFGMLSIIVSGLIPLVIGVFFIRYLTIKKHGIYSQRAIGVIHWPKFILHCIALRIKQYIRPRRLNNYNMKSLSYNDCGIVPTTTEVQLENSKSLITDRHDDSIFFWGGDQDGRIVVAKVVRLSRQRACVTLLVKTANGNIYTLPHQPDSNVINVANQHSWQGSGLLLECVEPMRTWRVKYNGFLRKGTRDQYITNDADDNDDLDFEKEPDNRHIIEARLDFLWKAAKGPIDIWHDSSVRLMADSLAREPGADSTIYEALERDGYDQWGVLHGTIQLGPNFNENWYLRGARQHRWGMSDSSTNLHRSVNLFMFFKNGNMAWIEAYSYKSLISHGVFGYVLTSSGKYLPMTSTNVELADMGEDGEVPKNICFEFTAGGTRYQCWHRLSDGIEVHSGDPWTLAHDYRPSIAISTGHGEGWGLAVFSKRFTALCPVPEKHSISIRKCLETPPDGEFVLPFTDINCTYVPLTGGKGASLACLSQIATKPQDAHLRFQIPQGVVVTSDAWEKQVKDSIELSGCINNLQKAVTSLQANQIKETCDRIQKVLSTFKVCETVIGCLREELEETFGSDLKKIRFAVRSSACGEDSDEASSAGQNATFLGCFWDQDGTDVLKALVLCWASQFTYQSVEYKRQRGQTLNDGMAVVVQRMISPAAAGVLFTRDPVTGSPASVLISANYGLGESVVSATSEPDTIIVQKTWRNKLRISNKNVGEKKTKCIMKDNGGTVEIEVSSTDRETICLKDDMVLKLAKIGLFVEDCYGSPRDIEFAIYENDVYLLQARPITSLFGWTDYELMHETDSPSLCDDDCFTLANTGEVLPGCISPLTLSTVVKALDIAIQKNLLVMEWPWYKSDFFIRPVATFFSTCFLNFGDTCLRSLDSEINMGNKVIDLSIFGRIVTTPEIHKRAISKYGIMNRPTKIFRTGLAFYHMFMNPRRVQSCRSIFANYEFDTNRVTSSESLYSEICRKLPEIMTISQAHSQSSSASTITQGITLGTMAENENEISPEMVRDLALLLCCISKTESADVPSSLKAMAKEIAASEEKDDFLSMNAEEGRVWLESHPGEVGFSFREFISKHGHRCIKEFDLRTLSWSMAPESLVGSLQTMVKVPATFNSQKKFTDISQIIDTMEIKLTSSKKRALKFTLNLSGKAVTLREATKSMLIKTVDAFRKAYRTLGLLMVSECRIPDADLIFFFHHQEIGTLLETRSAALVTKVINRRRILKELESFKFDEMNFGIPRPITNDDSAEFVQCSDTLTGTPVCLGIAKGTARIVNRLEDANTILAGDILITYSTDVGWTPYFPLLSGVVTEIGGLISHGAVVAREYGLPCIVGVKNATKAFTSGDQLILDGKKGTISKIQPNK